MKKNISKENIWKEQPDYIKIYTTSMLVFDNNKKVTK